MNTMKTSDRKAHGLESDPACRQQENAASATDLAQVRARLEQTQGQLAHTQIQLEQAQRQIEALTASTSWRATAPLRAVAGFARRARNALRYVLRGDIKGLRDRFHALLLDRAWRNRSPASAPRNWAVMATPHTLFIAHLVASRLRRHGWQAQIMTQAPPRFIHDMYVVICPQMFTRLPPGERRIAFQMEQSVSSRWFTSKYLHILENSLAVLEYSLNNIEFLDGRGIKYPHVYYLPIGASRDYMSDLPRPQPSEKKWDLLFYGDAKSSPRRQKMLATLQQHFKVRICSEVFGEAMVKEILQARAVINIHYYENALLELPRIQECLSLGVPLVSESSSDQMDYPEILDAVTFFEQGNEQDMLRAVQTALAESSGAAKAGAIERAVAASSQRFDFMFDRFLTAMNFLAPAQLIDDDLPLPGNATRVVLSLPETIARRRLYEAAAPKHCDIFDGVRFRQGWVGCGLSYASLARHALRNGQHRLTILEDDALLPPDFEEKLGIIHAYLDSKGDQWDIFAGLIADPHPGMQALHAEHFQGMRFVTINRMVSMVCNIYNERALRLLAQWDPADRDPQTNTIDRFLERQMDLRVVVALPFLVGHREDVHSTLWGFQNTQYHDMIKKTEQLLEQLAKA